MTRRSLAKLLMLKLDQLRTLTSVGRATKADQRAVCDIRAEYDRAYRVAK